MEYLAFEKPIEELTKKLEKAKELGLDKAIDVSKTVSDIEKQISISRKEIYNNLSSWEKVQLSRHPQRPYSLDYFNALSNGDFIELHGDRGVKDDKAMIGGWGTINEQSVMFIGQQKGRTTKERQYRNFGMANPEGYRKALRLMKMAEKFDKPIICFIDTPGAFPGLEAEERGQGQAIANNILKMTQLSVPIIIVIIGEGASGGALGIGVGDKILMLNNSWYSVISPENCSTILWGNWEHKETAADALKLTAKDMKKIGLVDEIIKEPLGGAHTFPEETFKIVKKKIISVINELKVIDKDTLVNNRMEKFSNMGEIKE
ncbi:MAG: acetyl-CoA carboxylase carboxyltransferase subunit alpha [Flavobacteriales bacterium]|jgi:acetyl-CoA carboxylase carboxyl transferase subunit alpha|nr:acetyl-CoA carboxylase carboxyltransferase subunit alpha [Flavobacteriales bacterium]MDG2086615.1 acetyl-CoA carboxylase carboxyltransferase subunit alpha [Flavobacteriales bacterium]|tara:strand:+ start:3766 stop:4719 length:954 start_codon:yes stop_codon:yes gene_type:complete